MQQDGYVYAATPAEFTAIDFSTSKRVIGLFADKHFGKAQDREPSLTEMTRAALQLLSRSNEGFFLVVEGSQIDWAGHDNDADQIPIEMADFDDAIGEVLRFAEKRDDTLIIVTADHETGGYALVDGSLEDREVEGRFSTRSHTGTMIPLFATGPSAERFAGIQTNFAIGQTLIELTR